MFSTGFYYWKALKGHSAVIHLMAEKTVGNNKILNRGKETGRKDGRNIFCGSVAWQRCSSGTDVPTNLICDAAWCEDLWVVVTCRGRREINGTQTDNCTSEGPTRQHRKKSMNFFLSPEEELMLWEREGMRIYSRAAYCGCLNWYEYGSRIAKPTPCLHLWHTHQIMMLRWHHCATVHSTKFTVPACGATHHGELGLQFFDPVLLHVHLRSQDVGLLSGFFGLPPQVPLLPL